MTRTELKEFGIEDKAIIDKIMDSYGAGVEKAKADTETLKNQMAEKDKAITELNEKIKAFDGTETKLKELIDKVATYEQKETERIEAEKQAQIDAEFSISKGVPRSGKFHTENTRRKLTEKYCTNTIWFWLVNPYIFHNSTVS